VEAIEFAKVASIAKPAHNVASNLVVEMQRHKRFVQPVDIVSTAQKKTSDLPPPSVQATACRLV
jgi:hypothetical protein